jgi:hypothetical protein
MKWVVVSTLLLATVPAWAKKPQDVFRKQIVVSAKRFPMRFSSDSAMISFLRQHRKKEIWPEKDGTWKFEFMCFFADPLNDLQVSVKFFDLTEGNKRFVNAFDQFTSERGQRILASSIVLEKPQFGANRKYRMIVSNRGRELAETTFTLRGEGPKHSGKVEFSDEETTQSD